jgi:hypothetical protein
MIAKTESRDRKRKLLDEIASTTEGATEEKVKVEKTTTQSAPVPRNRAILYTVSPYFIP